MPISFERLNRNDELYPIDGDETCIHYSTPYCERFSITWKQHVTELLVQKKFKRTISSKKKSDGYWIVGFAGFTSYWISIERWNNKRLPLHIAMLGKVYAGIQFERRGELRSRNVKLLRDNRTGRKIISLIVEKVQVRNIATSTMDIPWSGTIGFCFIWPVKK